MTKPAGCAPLTLYLYLSTYLLGSILYLSTIISLPTGGVALRRISLVCDEVAEIEVAPEHHACRCMQQGREVHHIVEKPVVFGLVETFVPGLKTVAYLLFVQTARVAKALTSQYWSQIPKP